jgi:hypothetical protein
MEQSCGLPPDDFRDFQSKSPLVTTGTDFVRGDGTMTWLGTEDNSKPRTFAQKLGLQLLMLLLFFYFSYSGAAELGLVSGISRKFDGHIWLANIMGIVELFGGLALLRPEGALGGAYFLIVATSCGLISTLLHGQTYAALECLLMLNVCILIAYWRRPKSLER